MASPEKIPSSDVAAYVRDVGRRARAAARVMARAETAVKNAALEHIAAGLVARQAEILSANGQDVAEARKAGLDAAMVERLELNEKRVAAMAEGLRQVAALEDPVGRIRDLCTRPSGIQVGRMRVPLGVVGIIYESRPNVTADAAALCLKSGNAAILRGGSESFHSSGTIAACLRRALEATGLPAAAIQQVPTTDRAAVGEMLRMAEFIDVIVPRGGRGLIERVTAESRIPVLKHLDGICHTYLDGAADPEMARRVVLNAKMRRTGICGATETLLVDRRALPILPPVLDDLITAGCELRGDDEVRALDSRVGPASEADWSTEYLDAILSVKVVDGVDAAIAHINRYGSHHTEAIITEDAAAAERFLAQVDAGIVMHNTSTQFADGGEFGMGAEIGISTGKLHARGPVGAEQLTSYKYVVRGAGQTRP